LANLKNSKKINFSPNLILIYQNNGQAQPSNCNLVNHRSPRTLRGRVFNALKAWKTWPPSIRGDRWDSNPGPFGHELYAQTRLPNLPLLLKV